MKIHGNTCLLLVPLLNYRASNYAPKYLVRLSKYSTLIYTNLPCSTLLSLLTVNLEPQPRRRCRHALL